MYSHVCVMEKIFIFLFLANKGDSKDRGKKVKRGGSGKSNDGRGSVSS